MPTPGGASHTDHTDAGLQPLLEFAATSRRQSLLMAMLAAAFGVLIIVSVSDAVEALAPLWRALALVCVTVPCVWLTWTLVRQALNRQPVVRLDAAGIGGASLAQPIPWDALDDAQLERGYGGGVLRLWLKPDPSRPDKPRFIDGRNPARPRIGLHMLSLDQQDAVFYAVHARLGVLRIRAGIGEAASLRETRADAAFEARLDQLTPRTWALYGVVGINVLVWGMNVAAGLSPTQPLSVELLAWGANSAAAVVLDGDWWRLLTCTFLHGGLMHIAFNMLGLWDSGRQLSRLLGNAQFLLIYLAAALCGSVASLHQSAQTSVSVGASGAVFGVLGALLAASWHYRRHLPAHNSRRLWSGLGIFVAYSLLNGLGKQNVDNAAHFGGLACGAVLGLLLLAPFDAAFTRAQRYRHAGFGAIAALAAVGMGVMATPVPVAWHRQVYEAQEVLPGVARRFEQVYRQLAVDSRRLQKGELGQMQFLQNAQRYVAPGCRDIETATAPLRAPRWEPVGRAVFLYRSICAASSESLDIEIARLRKDPQLRPDADARLKQLSSEMEGLMRQLATSAHGAAPPTPSRPLERKP